MKEDQKKAILQVLEAEKAALSLSQIASKLTESHSERSTRRWIKDLVDAGKIEKIGQKKNTVYRILSTPSSQAGIFSAKSLPSLNYLQQALFKREPKSYRADWLEEYQPNMTYYLSAAQREHLKMLGTRDYAHDPAGTYARKIYHRLLIDLSYHSSRLEGNTYSRLDTEKLILEGAENSSKLDEEKVMILNHKEAIRYLVDNALKLNVDENTIYTLHYLLSDGLVPAAYSGKVRDHSVRVSASTYITLEGAQTLEKQLHRVIDKAKKIVDPFEQSFFLLVHIAYLQAFADVNKRTSRLSANIALIKNNLVPLSFNDIDKEDYISAMLAIYELNDIHPLAELYLFSYERTCQEYSATLDVLGFDETRVRFRRERRDIIRHIILNKLHHDALTQYINQQSKTLIPQEFQENFIEDIQEDLNYIDASRIAGLGISSDDLESWRQTS